MVQVVPLVRSEDDQGSIQTFGTNISCQQKGSGGEICGEMSRTPDVARARLAVTGTCKCLFTYSVRTVASAHISSGARDCYYGRCRYC